MNIFSHGNSFSTNNSRFNKSVVMEGDDPGEAKRLLDNGRFQSHTLDAFTDHETWYIGINACDTEFVPDLKGQTTLGAYQPGWWILDEKEIEAMFRRMRKMESMLDRR